MHLDVVKLSVMFNNNVNSSCVHHYYYHPLGQHSNNRNQLTNNIIINSLMQQCSSECLKANQWKVFTRWSQKPCSMFTRWSLPHKHSLIACIFTAYCQT